MEAANCQTIFIDLRGQICPSSLLMALKSVNRHQQDLRAGRVTLRLATDNRDATATIPGAVQNMGYRVEIRKAKDYYDVLISAPD